MTTNFTDKQKRFINSYIHCLNATQAAKDAGYKCDNDAVYSVVGHENLRKPKIRAEIDRILAKNTINPDELLGRISEQATGDMGDFVEWSNDFGFRINLTKAEQRGKLHLIKKFKETENRRVDKDGGEYITLRREIELYDASAAQDRLMRYYSLYKDKVVHEWQRQAENAGIPLDLAEELFNEDVKRLAKKKIDASGD